MTKPGVAMADDKGGHFGPDLAADDRVRARIFRRIRNPLLPAGGQEAKDQAIASFMPPLSGDEDERTEGEPTTWLSLLPSQYRKFKKWKDGEFDEGQVPRFPAFEDIDDPAEQVIALQRAALEPCVGGALFPGIEMSWTVRETDLYADAFRINSDSIGPGDITQYMCSAMASGLLRLQDTLVAGGSTRRRHSANRVRRGRQGLAPGQPQVSEGLEGRVRWDRGLGVTTLFRRPWKTPRRRSTIRAIRSGVDATTWSATGASWVSSCRAHTMDAAGPKRTGDRSGRDGTPSICGNGRTRAFPLPAEFGRASGLPAESGGICRERPGGSVGECSSPRAPLPGWTIFGRFTYDEEIFDQRMKDIYDDCADFAFHQQATESGSPTM